MGRLMVYTYLFLLFYNSSFFRLKINPLSSEGIPSYSGLLQSSPEYVKLCSGLLQEPAGYVKSYSEYMRELPEYMKLSPVTLQEPPEYAKSYSVLIQTFAGHSKSYPEFMISNTKEIALNKNSTLIMKGGCNAKKSKNFCT